jgi:hypothetical protein
MNSVIVRLLFFLLISCEFISCSVVRNFDIEKRYYRRGFYLEKEKHFSVADSLSTISFRKNKRAVLCINSKTAATKIADVAIKPQEIFPHIQKNIQKNYTPKKTTTPEKTIQPIQKKRNTKVPDWLSNFVSYFFLFLICVILPPYWLFWLSAIYWLAKKRKVAGPLVLLGLISSVAFIFAIAFLIAASPFLLAAYLVALGLGLIGYIIMVFQSFK